MVSRYEPKNNPYHDPTLEKPKNLGPGKYRVCPGVETCPNKKAPDGYCSICPAEAAMITIDKPPNTVSAEAVQTYNRAPGRLETPAEGVPPPDPVTEAIRWRFLSRQRIGFTRYGIGLNRGDFTMDNWLQHLEEELMDALQYVVRLRMTLDGTLPIIGSRENISVGSEHPAEEVSRLVGEIDERNKRIRALLGQGKTNA